MADTPSSKRGHAPASIATRFTKNQSGNPAGRPRKAAPAAETSSTSEILARIARTKVPVESENGIREVDYVEALIHRLASAALKNPREGFRMLQLITAAEGSLPLPTVAPEPQPGELLDDPIVKRMLEREMRRRLRQKGEDAAAAELMRDQFGSTEGEQDASAGGDDPIEGA